MEVRVWSHRERLRSSGRKIGALTGRLGGFCFGSLGAISTPTVVPVKKSECN